MILMKSDKPPYPTCPNCGSTDFFVDGFIGYRQPYDAKADEYATSEVFWDEDYATAAVCAHCEADATEVLKKFNRLSFCSVEFKDR
jgi:hypothetical protein